MAIVHEFVDAISHPLTRYRMEVGDYFFGFLENDTDWIAVDLVAGQTYAFGLIGIGTEIDDLYDTRIVLRSASGVELVSNADDGPGFAAAVSFTASVTGRYFIDAGWGGVDSAYGPYGLSVVRGERPSYHPDMAAAALYRELNYWDHQPGERIALTWGFQPAGQTTDFADNPVPRVELTAAQKAAVALAMFQYGQVCNIAFSQVAPGGTTETANILFGAYAADDDTGGYADQPEFGQWWAEGVRVQFNNASSFSQVDLLAGTPSYYTVLHEIGHALGLEHAGDYAAGFGEDIAYDTHANYFEDSEQFTVMSYFRASHTEPTLADKFPDTPMLFDILALQTLYGANMAAYAGNTVYGFRGNAGGVFDFRTNRDPLLCIWDGGGNDTINLSGFSADQRVNLQDGSFSDVGGYRGNLSIAFGAKIENATGGSGADAITGNRLANTLRGLDGQDTLAGDAGNDVLDGGRGNDRLVGGTGQDRFVFGVGYGRDVIVDFQNDVDTLRLDRSLWGGGVPAPVVLEVYGQQVGDDVRLAFASATLVLRDLRLADLLDDLAFF